MYRINWLQALGVEKLPSSWKGMFQGKAGVPTVVLEAIADHNCQFWHFNFGSPGTLNDLNILDCSPLFDNAIQGVAPEVEFVVNRHTYKCTYWLADGIYAPYACFVKSIPKPKTRMQRFFSTSQEAKRKDIERAFGILQARFHILTSGCRLWDCMAMGTVIKTCVIRHNLVIDYEREHSLDPGYISSDQYIPLHSFIIIPKNAGKDSAEHRQAKIAGMQASDHHHELQHDLMVEVWEKWFDVHGVDPNDDVEGNDSNLEGN